MKYAPLPWVHLADALRTSLRRLRIVLEEPAFTAERTFVRLHDGPRSESIVETRPLLQGAQTPLSARERAVVEILHEAGPSHAKKGRFSLTKAQVGRLLAFAADVPLEADFPVVIHRHQPPLVDVESVEPPLRIIPDKPALESLFLGDSGCRRGQFGGIHLERIGLALGNEVEVIAVERESVDPPQSPP